MEPIEMDTTPAGPLLTALEQLAPHDHLCSIYESPAEHFAVAIPFIRIGLDRGEKCIYLADDGTETVVREALCGSGIDVERAIASESLVLAKKEDTYLKHGFFDPDWMFTFWADATAEAMSQGYTALRATGETEWVLRGAPGLERWLGRAGLRTCHNCVALCKQPTALRRSSSRRHPHASDGDHRGVVCGTCTCRPMNPRHRPSGVKSNACSRISGSGRIEHTLREQRSELRRSEERFRRLVELMPVAVYVCDTSGIIQHYNNRAVELWGRAPQVGDSASSIAARCACIPQTEHWCRTSHRKWPRCSEPERRPATWR